MNDGFNVASFDHLASLEASNFWFRTRNQIILWSIKKYAPNLATFLEIGCGTGFVSSAIANAFPETKFLGSEFFEEGLMFARARVPNANFIQLDARSIPHDSEFSAIGAFDVLEHVEEDGIVLQQIHKALLPGGILFITVPQHQWLWSSLDEHACHERRYSARNLHQQVETAGFKIIRSTSFVTSLLPLMLLSRILKKNKSTSEYTQNDELRLNPVLNKIFEYFMKLDAALIYMGMSLPVGGSRLLVAEKR